MRKIETTTPKTRFGAAPPAWTARRASRPALLLLCALAPGLAAAQNVLWEDYRGQDNVPSDANYIGTPGAPKFDNFPNNIAMPLFRALTADPANAARTGSSPNIDFRQAPQAPDEPALCNSTLPNWTTSTACRYQAQGRVMYSLISFPLAGTYTLQAAHDDNLVVELSTDYTNTNYRNASYDIPVGALAEYTSNDQTFATVGTFNAASPSSCALIRVYWTNQNGVNHSRLRWTLPNGTTEIVPASAFRDPSQPVSAADCNGSITGQGRALVLNKVLGTERVDPSDQFVIEIGTSPTGGTVRAAVTAGSGTGQAASTGAFPAAANTTYYLREAMAAGSVSSLAAYDTKIECSNNGAPFVPTQVGAPGDRIWSVATSGGDDQIVCSIANAARLVDLRIDKQVAADNVASGDDVEYTLVVTNDGPSAATGATVTDAPGAGLTCPAASPVTCSSSASPSACPAAALTMQDLLNGVVLGALPAGASVTFGYTCTAD
ncbi:DUF11 domain-containing protein [Luteimonas huabeiensis]|uniref:DUF11 domain-containing protein n=1 Tax=Luteimonas huabeiensis TaxID=1244513 RepID=UPI0004648EF8|nr:DUF11 domain-containing protein [Luteimonas huabeiensis]